jgi:hypothetical protein
MFIPCQLANTPTRVCLLAAPETSHATVVVHGHDSIHILGKGTATSRMLKL